MLDIWFFFLFAISIGLLAWGFFGKSVALVSLASVLFIVLGLSLMTEGIWVPSTYTIDANSTVVDSNYTQWLGNTCSQDLQPQVSHCFKDNSLVLLGTGFFYGGIVMLVISIVLIVFWAYQKK